MAKAKDRSNTYWRARIARDHPAILARLDSGEIPTVRAARRAAGLLRLPSRLEQLMRDWQRLDLRERDTFLRWAFTARKPRDELPLVAPAETPEEGQLSFF